MPLEIGVPAPDFTLKNQFGQLITLSDYRGLQNVVLTFFPKAFTSTCTNELCELVEQREDFETDDIVVIGVSTDTDATLKAFAEANSIEFQLLSDHWPHGRVAMAYDVFLESRGFANRGTFIIDKEGIVRWSVVRSLGEPRDPSDYRAALAAL